jgi:Protein kinase domain
MTERLAPEVGANFAGYTIDSVLGRGGMGTVYLATHERLARKVALKVITPELAHDERFRSRFLRESQLAAALDHPNVVPIYDADEAGGILYLAMRYVPGASLRTLLQARGRLTAQQTVRLADQIAGALDAAHAAGLVHRDVKPANILLGEPDDHAYLCDFGLAKHARSDAITQTGTFLGTIDYCAPEQIRGEPVSGRTDLYSLGCVLFHCLAGSPPYRREGDLAVVQAHLYEPPPTLSSLRSDLPRALDSVLATAMAKDPDARYATCRELATRLAAALADTDDSATRAAPLLRAPRHRRRGRRLATSVAVVVVIAVAAATAAVLATRGGQDGDMAKLRTFVDRVDNVLDQSTAGRREIGSALAGGLRCTIPAREASQRIASVADNRQSILEQLGTLPTPSPQADAVVTLLQRALQQSIEVDRHYRDAFVAAEGKRCPLPDSLFAVARADDVKATAAKRRFVSSFNPLARRVGSRVWSAGSI